MTGRMGVAARGILGLMLSVLAWAVSRSYVQLTGGEALLVGGLILSAVLCPSKRAGAWRIITPILLALTLLGFWFILRDRLADRNLVLVGVLVALTGLFAAGGKE